MKREDKIALIDGDSLIYYEMKKNTLEEALAGIDMRITQMLNITGCKYYAGFLTKGKCFRYNVATTRPYKYNRKRDDLPIIFPALKEYLQQQWKFTYVPELEADDLVSVYHDPLKTIICSPDKDVLYQNKVHNYNYGKGEFVEVDENDALRFLWKQVLMGDSTDGIMGIPKVGPKTAEGWLKDMHPSDMPTFVLNKYIEKFGNSEGIHRFTETFKLIYILKSKEDVLRETGIELPDLITHKVEFSNQEELW
jgi:5'-3' exonuclease